MSETELRHIVRGALASFEAGRGDRETSLGDVESELMELLARQLPGSDREAILSLIRECVSEARAGGQG